MAKLLDLELRWKYSVKLPYLPLSMEILTKLAKVAVRWAFLTKQPNLELRWKYSVKLPYLALSMEILTKMPKVEIR